MHTRNAKSQIIGQVFVYLFASLIFIIVLLYGYRAIEKFGEQRNYVALIELRTKLVSTVNSIASSQSTQRVTLTMPSGTQKICFLDLRKNPDEPGHFTPNGVPGICKEDEEDFDPRICNAWRDNVSKNVYFWPTINMQIKVGDITLRDTSGNDQGYLCLEVAKDVVYLELKGQGDSTSITQWIP